MPLSGGRLMRSQVRIRGKKRAGPGQGYRVARRRIARGAYNPMPTFVETFHNAGGDPTRPYGDFTVTPAGTGKIFKVAISDLPQFAQYASMYNQYRINWVKILLIPDYNMKSADANAATYNLASVVQNYGQIRVVHAINDSPALGPPPNEGAVLTDNGCKIRALGSKWSVSFKPTPDVALTDRNNAAVWMKPKYRQFFNFNTTELGDNPDHGSVQAFFTLASDTPTSTIPCRVYYKVSFTLRDPK